MPTPKAQIIDPRDVTPRAGQYAKPVFDAEAVQRADETLKAMSVSLEQWLEADVQKLQAAWHEAERLAWSDAALASLFAAAHDLKGMGGTYGYPLATEIAASLCRLVETDAGKRAARANPSLVCAHVDALRAVVRDRIASRAHPIGRALLQVLETHVANLGVAPE